MVQVFVKRKTTDLVRVAAEDLLRASHPEVRRVDRGELWTFELHGAEGELELQRLLEETTLLVNPNLHRVSRGAPSPVPASGARLTVLVHDRVDPKPSAVLRAARDRRGFRHIEKIERAVLWTLDVDTPQAAEALGREIAGPEGGLLANPHAQDVERKVTHAA